MIDRGNRELSVGPVEYIVLEFPDHEFHAEIAPAIASLVESGTVRIIDIVFVRKEADGKVGTFEFDELEELAPFARLPGEAGGLIGQEDIDYATATLAPNAAAVIMLWEDTWARQLDEAVRRAHGTIVEGARVPPALAEAALESLTSPSTSDERKG